MQTSRIAPHSSSVSPEDKCPDRLFHARCRTSDMKIITTTIAIVALSLSTSALAAGGLTKAAVRNLVKPTESTVKSCSQSAGVYGTLKVRFKVNADGSVSDFTSLAPHKDDAAAKCASDA